MKLEREIENGMRCARHATTDNGISVGSRAE